MILTYSKLGTLMYYSSLLSSWQCIIFLRDYDDNVHFVSDIFNRSDEHTKFKCKEIYIRSFFSNNVMQSFRSYISFINTFKVLHHLHVFQIDNIKFQ